MEIPKLKKIKSKNELYKDGEKYKGYLINADEKEARRIIESLKNKKFKGIIAVYGREGDFNRRALETLKINFLVSPERGFRKDTLKQRDSGLNHVLAKIAVEKKIEIVIDFEDIKKMEDKKQKSLRLARVIQNIKICRKAKCKVLIWDFSGKAEKKMIESFAFSLGMSSQQASKCL